jgi:hypothetical protein
VPIQHHLQNIFNASTNRERITARAHGSYQSTECIVFDKLDSAFYFRKRLTSIHGLPELQAVTVPVSVGTNVFFDLSLTVSDGEK